jgi:TPP-dependent pyruvate/acetoin dehydrogenase alpha subunit
MTYRFVGHSRSDPGAYRKPGELEAWKRRDPLAEARLRLNEQYGVDGARVDGADAEVQELMAAVVENGLNAPYPAPGEPVREFKDSRG